MLPFSEIQDRVIQIVALISGIPREEIRVESTFEELDLDSLSRIEVLVELEREFEIETIEDENDEDILKQIKSVEDAARLVKQNLAEQSAS